MKNIFENEEEKVTKESEIWGKLPQYLCSIHPYSHFLNEIKEKQTKCEIENCPFDLHAKCDECLTYHLLKEFSKHEVPSSPQILAYVKKMKTVRLANLPEKEEERKIIQLIQRIRRRKIFGTVIYAKVTAELLREIVILFDFKKDKISTLLCTLRRIGRKLCFYNPSIFVIGNFVRRVLFLLREEIFVKLRKQKEDKEGETNEKYAQEEEVEVYHKRNLGDMFSPSLIAGKGDIQDNNMDIHLSINDLKDIKLKTISEISDLISNMKDSLSMISSNCLTSIQKNEVILTIGFSHTIFDFLSKAVKKKIDFKIIVTEHAPDYSGHEMAEQLGNLGIETVLIPDSSIFAVMSRVNKVIIGTRAVMANGGLVAESGAHIVCMAAKKHNVPVVVCTAIYKLTPQYPTEKHITNHLNNPNDIIDCQELKNVHAVNAEFDYVPPEFINLFVTNDGIHNPSYIYRLLMEMYDPEDYKL